MLRRRWGLESRVAELEGERFTLREEVQALHGVRIVLEAEVAVERQLLATVSQVTWEAMESLEGTVTELGAVPPPRKHTLVELDVTLERLHHVGEVLVPAA